MMAPHKHIRVSTGIEGLDRMLDGGLIAGRTYMLSGNSGSGKSTICGHFLMDGVKRDEEVLYVTIDSSPADISACFNSFSWDSGKMMILNAHPKVREYKVRGSLIEVAAQRHIGSMSDMNNKEKAAQQQSGTSPDLSLPSLQLMLQKEFEAKSYDRLVIDSMLSLRMLGAEEVQWEIGINSILRLLMEEGITTLLVSNVPSKNEPIPPEFLLSRGILKTTRLIVSGKVYRGIYVEKFRGSNHDTQIRPVKISSRGMEVDTTKSLPSEIITEIAEEFPRP